MEKLCDSVSSNKIKMWTKFEINKIGELYGGLPEEKLEDYFPTYILDAIKREEGKAYENLRKFYTCVNFDVKLHV